MLSPEESHGITGTIILMAYARQTKISAAHKIFGMSLSPDIKTWLIAAIIENKGLSSHKSHCSKDKLTLNSIMVVIRIMIIIKSISQ
jgi:hypothetical protein